MSRTWPDSISPSEVEQVFGNDPMVFAHHFVAGEERWSAVGVTNSLRVLVVAYTMRGDRIRPITGWNAGKFIREDYFRKRGS